MHATGPKLPGGCEYLRDEAKVRAVPPSFQGSPMACTSTRLYGYQLPVTIDWIDPLVEIRTPDWNLPVGRSVKLSLGARGTKCRMRYGHP